MKLSINKEALAQETARQEEEAAVEAKEVAKAEAAKIEEAKAAKLALEKASIRHEKVSGIMLYNVHLVPRKVMGIVQEAVKLIQPEDVYSIVFEKHIEHDNWDKEHLGRFYQVPKTAVVCLENCVEYAIDESAKKDNEFSVIALCWLQLLSVPIHEMLHSIYGEDEAKVEKETMNIIRQLGLQYNIEIPILDGNDYFTTSMNEYISSLADVNEENAVTQISMAHNREIYRASDNSASIHDFREWVRLDAPEETKNNEKWHQPAVDIVLDNVVTNPTIIAPTITPAGVAAATTLPTMPAPQATEMLAGNDFPEPPPAPETLAPAPTQYQQAIAQQPATVQPAPVAQPVAYTPAAPVAQPVQPVQQVQSQPSLQNMPWYSPVAPPAITMSKPEQWAIQDTVFARLFLHMRDKCGFLMNGLFDPNSALNIREGVSVSDVNGAQELFLAMDCGTGDAAKYTRNVNIFDNVNNGAIRGWWKRDNNTLSYILHVNTENGHAVKVLCKFQNPNANSSTGPLAAQGVPIMWITMPGDRSKNIEATWLYKVDLDESNNIRIATLADQRGADVTHLLSMN